MTAWQFIAIVAVGMFLTVYLVLTRQELDQRNAEIGILFTTCKGK